MKFLKFDFYFQVSLCEFVSPMGKSLSGNYHPLANPHHKDTAPSEH